MTRKENFPDIGKLSAKTYTTLRPRYSNHAGLRIHSFLRSDPACNLLSMESNLTLTVTVFIRPALRPDRPIFRYSWVPEDSPPV